MVFIDSTALKVALPALQEEFKKEIVLESSKFSAAQAPESLTNENKVIINRLLKVAFVNSFNKVVYLASFLMLLDGIMAFFSIENQPRTNIEENTTSS